MNNDDYKARHFYLINQDERLQREIPRMVKLFQAAGVRRILDVGCANGGHTLALESAGFETRGIDPNEDSIQAALEHRPADSDTTFAAHALAEEARQRPHSAEGVLCIGNVLSGVIKADGLAGAVAGLARVLEPSGYLLGQIVNGAWVRARGACTLPVRSLPAREGRGLRLFTRTYVRDTEQQALMVVTRLEESPDGVWSAESDRHEMPLPLPETLDAALRAGGFERIRYFSTYDGQPFHREESSTLIWEAYLGG
jgi:SAM-dependent methyltransferase